MPAFTTIARSKLKQPHNDIFLYPLPRALLPTLAVGMTLGTVLQMTVDFENVDMDTGASRRHEDPSSRDMSSAPSLPLNMYTHHVQMPRVHLAVCQASLSSGCHDLAQVSDWGRHTRRPAMTAMRSICLALTGPSDPGHQGLACYYLRPVRLPPLQAAGSSTNKKAREARNFVVQAARSRVSLGSCTRRRHALAELDELNQLCSFC